MRKPLVWKLRKTFLLSKKCLERLYRRPEVPLAVSGLSNRRASHERPDRLSRPKTPSALQAYAAVSAGAGHHALQEGHGRGRASREGARQGHARRVARGAAGAFGSGLWRHQSLPAPGAPEAVALDPGRQG